MLSMNKSDTCDPRAESIALLFLTRGEVPNSKIWEEWLKPVDTDHYSIYVHAKVNSSVSDQHDL